MVFRRTFPNAVVVNSSRFGLSFSTLDFRAAFNRKASPPSRVLALPTVVMSAENGRRSSPAVPNAPRFPPTTPSHAQYRRIVLPSPRLNWPHCATAANDEGSRFVV